MSRATKTRPARKLVPAGMATAGMASAPGVSESREPDAFRVWLRFLRLDQRLRLMMGRRLREIGLSIPQFDVLSALDQRAGITQRELAQKLFVTKGNVSGLIDRLVEAKLVERRSVALDRRSHSLFLTREGKRVAAAGFAVQTTFVEATLGQLPPHDLETLHLLLGQWRDVARQAGRGGSPEIADAPGEGAPGPKRQIG
jgi:DNA-binding MarR family transcriptional regulator